MIKFLASWKMAIIMAAFMLIFVSPITSAAIYPIAVSVTTESVSVRRVFLADYLGLPRPIISYDETVRPLTPLWNGGHPCSDLGGPFRYTSEQETAQWEIQWAADCTNDPVGFVYTVCWTWHVGMIEFGATCETVTYLAQRVD